jgi:hypothetical protein
MKSIVALAITAGILLMSAGCEKTVHEASAPTIMSR